MKKALVTNIEDTYFYTLLDENKNEYKKNFEFYDTTVNIGDYIYLDDSILKEENMYTYGPIIENNEIEDLIKIIHNDKEIYLQRYYG